MFCSAVKCVAFTAALISLPVGQAGADQASPPPSVCPSDVSSLPAKLSHAEWYSAALKLAGKAQGSGVQIIETRSSSQEILLHYCVTGRPEWANTPVALVIPLGDLTSSSLERIRVWDRDSEGRLVQKASPTTGPITCDTVPMGFIRNCRIARLRLPVQAGPHRISDAWLRITFSRPPASAGDNGPWADEESRGILRELVGKYVANPDDMARFSIKNPALIPGPEEVCRWDAGTTSSVRIKIPVTETGLYRISGTDLQSSGVAIAAMSPDDLHLWLNGKEQPLHYVRASAKPSQGISPEDGFVFYGLENPSEFSRANCYWILADSTRRRMDFEQASPPPDTIAAQTAVSFTDKAVIKQDREVKIQNDQFLSILGYRWVWQELKPGVPFVFDFDAPGLLRRNEKVAAKACFFAHSWAPGRKAKLQVGINNAPLQEIIMTSESDAQKLLSLPPGTIQEHGNHATVQLVDEDSSGPVGAADQHASSIELWFEKLELEYPRAYSLREGQLEFRSPVLPPMPGRKPGEEIVDYRISGTNLARHLVALDITESAPKSMELRRPEGDAGLSQVRFRAQENGTRRYIISETDRLAACSLQPARMGPDLHSTSNRADYVIISHRDFIDLMRPYAKTKASEGFEVAVVDVADIYDQFSAGQETPQAIRSFIRYASTHWRGSTRNPAASFVLLVGDSTSAYRNEFHNSVVNYVPTFTVHNPMGTQDRFASDSWYATMMGDDMLADTLIGRFSVNNARDLGAILAKQENYRTKAEGGPWHNTLGYVADHSEFKAPVEKVLRESVPHRFFISRVFMDEEPWIDNYYFPKEIADLKKAKVSPVCTRKIRDMINTGAAMITYFGHGSPNIWSNERIWFGGDSENSDNLMLINRDRLPFIVNMTCNSGAIDYPMPQWNICISEDFMRVPGGGAVACYVPSGPGVTSQHERFTVQINRALLAERIAPLGAGLALANWRYLQADNSPDLSRMFILLGDPALNLRISDPTQGTLPPPIPPAERLEIPKPFVGKAGWVQLRDASAGLSTAVVPFESTSTCVMLPRSPAPKTGPAAVSAAIADEPAASDSPISAAVETIASPALKVTSCTVSPGGLLTPGTACRALVSVENTMDIPLRGVRMELRGQDTALTATAAPIDFLPGATQDCEMTWKAPAGIQHYRIAASIPGLPTAQISGQPELVTVAAGLQSAVLADTSTLSVSYSGTSDRYIAQVQFQVRNALGHKAEGLRAAFTGPDHKPLMNSVVQVPVLESGASALLTMTRDSHDLGETYDVDLDAYRTMPDSVHWPRIQLVLGRSGMPDLDIPPDGVRIEPASPSSGETVFCYVKVTNRGAAPCRSVRVEGFDGNSTTSARLESRVAAQGEHADLDPGEAHVFRLRWDPFRNAGRHELLFRALSDVQTCESNAANNSRTASLYVRTGYKLHGAGMQIMPLTAQEKHDHTIRIAARIENSGETAAQGVKVVFYPTHNRSNPKEAMGEVMVDEVPATSTTLAVLRYKLKPGEEKRQFKFSFEAFLKGSRQRVPWQGQD